VVWSLVGYICPYAFMILVYSILGEVKPFLEECAKI
jgi:hypothetical protein